MLLDPVTVFWFRRDLRLHDNVALYHALQSGRPVQLIFIFDKNILDRLPERKDGRVDFIRRRLVELQNQLHQYGSGVDVRIGEPIQVWKTVLQEFKVASVYVNHDYEPYAMDRDNRIAALLREHGIGFNSYKDQVIFEKADVTKDNGRPYTIFTAYMKKWRNRLRPEFVTSCRSAYLLGGLNKRAGSIPSLQEIGFQPTDMIFPEPTFPEQLIHHYDQTRDYPALDATTRLGLHLRFGTVSIRELVRRGMLLNETWVNELIWREFFMQILFHFPRVVQGPFRPAYEWIPWQDDFELFEKWRLGQTGYPLVDAGMRELNSSGFMHNRVRMVTAGFLAKHLLINWQWGEKYFADKLLDFELSSNNGNWQWAAGCGCDSAPYFRIFSPERQAKKFDPQNQYIKKWVPEVNTLEYPKPIVEHTKARKRAIAAYQDGLHKSRELKMILK